MLSGRQLEFVGVEAGGTVGMGDCVGVVPADSVISCGVQCARDAHCRVFRYTTHNKTCTLYTDGDLEMVHSPGEWFHLGA